MIERFNSFLFNRRHMRACKKLAQMVEQRRKSFEAEQYRRRRKAALKHIPKSWSA